MSALVAVVLAAGKSTRMKSSVPKVLHPIFGRPMIEYVLDAARGAGVDRIVVVVGHKANEVQSSLSHHSDVEFALQSDQKGTGHAVMMCREHLDDHDGSVLVLAGDTPLLKSSSLEGLLRVQADERAACVIGTADTEANFGLGRIVRDDSGNFLRIVEQKDASPEEQQITEINTGCFAFDCRKLLQSLTKLSTDNEQGEYYLTDCPAIMKADGDPVVASMQFDIAEAIGVNTRSQLATVRQAIHTASLESRMRDGVTILDPTQVSIDPRARIESDTTIHPFVVIDGPVGIGENCEIGPHSVLRGSVQIPAETSLAAYSHLQVEPSDEV
ncbi:NTP transferase domain-containing protein [Thalassoroseus pseudoceratinae]|uniref:NTP transferase domain-containing protein n=1 Tax=Thalassoroseus pseudoceratinae TaxID=2713176 RepID=UPI001424023F|nr:NTP transferase domain-containing protein [Thalassoroseus pseudoceratinae]